MGDHIARADIMLCISDNSKLSHTETFWNEAERNLGLYFSNTSSWTVRRWYIRVSWDIASCLSVYHHRSCCSLRFCAPVATNLPFIILQPNTPLSGAQRLLLVYGKFLRSLQGRSAHTRATRRDTVYSPTKPPRSINCGASVYRKAVRFV